MSKSRRIRPAGNRPLASLNHEELVNKVANLQDLLNRQELSLNRYKSLADESLALKKEVGDLQTKNGSLVNLVAEWREAYELVVEEKDALILDKIHNLMNPQPDQVRKRPAFMRFLTGG